MPQLRVAVIGAGPAGIYAADILQKTAEGIEVSIDLFDRLPAPYGLVRYGVAPDHPRIKGIVNALRDVLDRGDIAYRGNVDYGTDITLADLKRHYHAVIFATGAIDDAPLEIPGIDLPGSFGAAAFVNWYDGHPDVPREWPLDAESVAVIGNGNVALDIARVLAKQADDLHSTEIPDSVYEGLRASKITDVHVFGRRGPAQVKFTPIELRELGEQRLVDIVVDDEDFELDPASEQAIAANKQVMIMHRIMNGWRERAASASAEDASGTPARRLHLHFYARPLEVLADESTGRVGALRYERTRPDGAGGVEGTGEVRELPIGQLYRAVGYFGSPLDEVPFDAARGVIPNIEGRVVTEHNEVIPGVYATGWIKRGPVGLIGHTKSDAMETVRSLLSDAASWWTPEEPEPEAVTRLLESRGVEYTDLEGWHALDEHERSLGEAEGRERVKVVPREQMVRVSRAGRD